MTYMIRFFLLSALLITTNFSFANEKTVESFVNSVAHKIIKVVTSTSSSETQKRSEIKSIISNNFDIKWMSKFVLGRNYKALSPAKQKEYQKLYLNYLVGNYFPIMVKYDNDKFVINHINKASKTSYNVDTTIQRVDKPTVSIRYHIRDKSSLKAVDMIVEGISTIISQRSEFDSIIQQEGLHGFMKKMEEMYG